MPNLKEAIVKLLEDFPGRVVEGKQFHEYLDDLAEDIQAEVIKAVVACPNKAAALPQPSSVEKALAHFCLDALDARVEDLRNTIFGASLHNAVFLTDQRPVGLESKPIVTAMLAAFVLTTADIAQ